MSDSGRLVALFNQLFLSSENTRLIGGAAEPIYRPAVAGRACAEVVFTRDYFASALHEVAHWCIAGAQRRKLEDYGYWYQSDRNSVQQAAFEQAEIKPQALEKVFCECAGFPFQPSLDCLQRPEYHAPEFVVQVNIQYQAYLREGLPLRAEQFAQALLGRIHSSVESSSALSGARL